MRRTLIATICFFALAFTVVNLTRDPIPVEPARPMGQGKALPEDGSPTEERTAPSESAQSSEAQSTEKPRAAVDLPLEQDPEEQQAGFGTLSILVVGAEDGEPMPGVRLMLVPSSKSAPGKIRYTDKHQGRPEDVLLSDRIGKASFQVPAQQILRLIVWSEDASNPRVTQTIRRLSPLEDRGETVRLPTRLNRVSHARVLRAVDGSPVEGAVVSLRDHGRTLRSTTTDADGHFWLWRHSSVGKLLRIEAQGFTPALISAETETRLIQPITSIALAPEASLRFSVTGPGRIPVKGAGCVVSVRPELLARNLDREQLLAESFVFKGQTSSSGVALVSGLPANVPLDLQVIGLDVSLTNSLHGVHPLKEKPVLAPGETGEVIFQLPQGLELRGSLSDQNGDAIGDTELWVIRTESLSRRYLNCRDCGAIQTRTGADGRFLVTGLPEGSYLIGPSPWCPPDFYRRCPHSSNSQDVATVGTAVHMRRDIDNRIDLILDRGLALTGRVIDEAGKPIFLAQVSARYSGIGGASFNFRTDRAGRFGFYALVDVPWSLSVSSSNQLGSRFSRPLTIRPTTDEVLLIVDQVRDGGNRLEIGNIHGTLVNPATGTLPRSTEILLRESGARDWDSAKHTWAYSKTGKFIFHNLPPGSYRLGINVEEGGDTQLVTIPPTGGDVLGIELSLAPRVAVTLSVSQATANLERAAKGGRRPAWTYSLRVDAEKILRGVFWDIDRHVVWVPPGYVEAVVIEFDTGRELIASGMALLDEPLTLTY